MIRRDFVRPFNSWVTVDVPRGRDLNAMQQAAVEAINGDGGGTYAPIFPIILGGAGGTLRQHCALQGGLLTRRGGRYVLGGNDFDQFSPTRSRSILMPLLRQQSKSLEDFWNQTPLAHTGGDGTNTLVFGIPSRYLHQGGRLISITARIRVAQPHAGVPSPPTINCLRFDVGLTGFVGLASGGPSAFTMPGTGALWYAGGAVQSWTLTCDQNNTIDKGGFFYVLEITDEHGANSLPPNLFPSVTLNFDSIASMAFS
jgi:hypothetical protein